MHRALAGAAGLGAGDAGGARRDSTSAARSGSRAADPTADLSEADRALFQTLRSCRSKTARREGAPQHVVLTDRQFEVVTKQPATRKALDQGRIVSTPVDRSAAGRAPIDPLTLQRSKDFRASAPGRRRCLPL